MAQAGKSQTIRPYQIMSGSTLKLIAIVTMLIDHTAATVLLGYISRLSQMQQTGQSAQLFAGYQVMRCIGRTAFPIFCFLLCEGFFHTRNRSKYAGRLLVFALLSELPFDLAIFKGLDWEHQNVYFTLLIGYLTIWAMHILCRKLRQFPVQLFLANALVLFAGANAAELFGTDYGLSGVVLIAIFYLLHERRVLSCIAGYISFIWEAWCFPAFLMIPLYNGKRGLSIKYLFYAFYPAHLLLCYAVERFMIGTIS